LIIITNKKLFPQLQRLINADLGDEFGDVGDEDQGAFELVEGFGDDGEVAEVDMIGRLVEDEEAGTFKHEAREGDQTFLSLGQIPDLGHDDIAGNKKARGRGAHVVLVFFMHDGQERVKHCVVKVERRKILPIVADLGSRRDGRAIGRAARDRLKHGAFADAVGT